MSDIFKPPDVVNPCLRVKEVAGTAVLNILNVIFPFDQVDFDNFGAWDSTNNWYVCPQDGTYWLGACFRQIKPTSWAENNGLYIVFLRDRSTESVLNIENIIGGANYRYGTASTDQSVSGVAMFKCLKGDKLYVYFQSNQTGTTSGGSPDRTQLSICRIGE